MANMKLIEAKTLGSNTASITFSSIPQTYTDLKILVSARDDRSGQPNTDLSLQVGYNGTINTGSIYSTKQLYGNGSTAGSQSSATTYAYLGMSNGPTSTANTFGNTEIYIPNYTSANYKSISTDGVSENNATTAYAVFNASLASTTNAITDIKISAVYGSGNFISGSTFYLYGISNVTTGSKATGGIVSYDATYYYHMFPYSGTFTPTQSLTADMLVIAGGGAGGYSRGGGGGAGGLVYSTSQSLTATAYTVTVGAGGASTTADVINNGSNSNVTGGALSLTAAVGGGGGANVSNSTGNNGGSGGGATSGGSAGTPTSGQGTQGGSGSGTGPSYGGGGGGGFGAAGSNGTQYGGGDGGIGTNTYSAWAYATQSGDSGYYAGGGVGGTNNVVSFPAIGGVGGGGSQIADYGIAGKANTGGGGGSGMNSTRAAYGGAGGSGIVIIRYAI